MKSKYKKGFTLVELIITLSLLTLVITISSNAILLLYRSHAMTVDEYTLQSSIRNTSSKVTDIIRYSQAVFAVPHEFVSDTSKLDPEWEYIALSSDKRSVVRYKYDTTTMTHIPETLVESQPNIEYEIVFNKQSARSEIINGNTVILNDNVLYFTIEAYVLGTDSDGNVIRTNQKVVYETELAATNALQVVDKGTVLSPAVALAYRKDDKTYGEGRSHVVKIALILDVSGSMAWIPGYDYTTPTGTQRSRLTHMKRAIIGNGLDGNSGIIAQFAAYPNFEITLVPFSNRASYIINPVRSIPFYNAQLEKSALVTRVNQLVANGSTNTGDGIRLAYYNMKEFDKTGYSPNVEQHDFTIILVDGDSNQYSYLGSGYNVQYYLSDGDEYNVWPDDSRYPETGFEYVTKLGEKILTTDSYTGEYYLIGYVVDKDSLGVKNIIEAFNIPNDQVFLYNNTNFDLSEVFSNIATDIMAKTWLVTGPQIQN